MTARFFDRVQQIARAEPVTIALLVGANVVPLIGVMFFDWDVFSVLFLYWLENGIVGVLNVPRILLASRNPRGNEGGAGGALVRAISFPIHYGVFWLVHGLFVFAIAGDRYLVATNANVPRAVLLALSEPGLLLAALALVVSHAANLWLNYIGRLEYLNTTPKVEQMRPYPRLIVLHLTIVLGGFAIVIVGRPAALVALLVIGKTLLDLGIHFAERTRQRRAATVDAMA